MYIGHRKEFLKLTIRASALRQSPKNESSFNGHCYQADTDTEIEPFCHPDRVVRGTFISTDIYLLCFRKFKISHGKTESSSQMGNACQSTKYSSREM